MTARCGPFRARCAVRGNDKGDTMTLVGMVSPAQPWEKLNMTTIQACVNPRLLQKADRLFTGTLKGRIVELLQNARRAGATKVTITNEEGCVTIKDDGRGIDDFAKLLDLGGSGWDEGTERSEDPAGVGIFCLAPRDVTIRSNGKAVTITKAGWTHEAVEVLKDPCPTRKGTILRFLDEEWSFEEVASEAAFCGLRVHVDGRRCPKMPFVTETAAHHPELGCRIEVRTSSQLSQWHRAQSGVSSWSHKCLVNFHGQVVGFDYHPISEPDLCYLVDLTGEPTGIRLMLPARTRLVENEAFQQLQAAIELEAYRYIERIGQHKLEYTEYLRARKLGITLPEATPTYTVGLIGHDISPEPVAVVMPADFPLSKCYRFDYDAQGEDTDETNVHLLAALGTFPEPFIPVKICSRYDGYSWAKLPTIGRVEVKVGNQLLAEWLWSGKLICVDSLVIAAHASDGQVFSSPICMAREPLPPEGDPRSSDEPVLVTPVAQDRLYPAEIWYHLGGFGEDGDTYDTQLALFEDDLNRFWADLIGPDEQLRRSILAPLNRIEPEWQSVTITGDGRITIQHTDGTSKAIDPPKPADAESSPASPNL
jgi:hypothetical protein